MATFLACKEQLSAVFSTIISNPLFVLKPKSTFLADDPIYFTIFLLIIMTSYTYYKNYKTDNCSYIDCVWSIAPIIYSAFMTFHYALKHNFELNERLALLFLLIVGWGVRLTYNLYIKGGYQTRKEDHRWSLIRTWFQGKPFQWQLFILFFINIYQQISIYMFTVLPLYIIYYGPIRMQLYDLPLTICFSIFLGIETIADFQMYEFQEGKRQQILSRRFSQKGDDKYVDGFHYTGLYKYSRHPNYFGELGQWWIIYLLSCIGDKKTFMFNWSIIGVLNLCFIIYKSMNLTESITWFKYPKYKIYAKRTSQFFLWPPTPPKDAKKTQ